MPVTLAVMNKLRTIVSAADIVMVMRETIVAEVVVSYSDARTMIRVMVLVVRMRQRWW